MDYGLDNVSFSRASSRLFVPSGYNFGFARILDIVVASIGLLFVVPVLIAIALAVTVSDRGPVIFAHRRIGRGGQTFSCLKFRTMVTDSEERLSRLLQTDPSARAEWLAERKLKRDPRITAVGAFLRKSSLDELPQLINVLRGEMSIVGPRPIVADEIALYGAYFSHYCSVNPGITGLWQISGRNNVTYRRRVAMDVLYARNKSVRWDLNIMFMTVPAVLLANGSY